MKPLVQLQYLQPGTQFLSPVLDGRCRTTRWQPGVLLYCNVSRARVKLDGRDHETNWPPTLEVEPVRPTTSPEEGLTMSQNHKALRAKFNYHTERLSVASATGDPTKIARAEAALAKVREEAEASGLALDADTTETTTNQATVGVATEEPEMVQTKKNKTASLKAANQARIAKLKSKKEPGTKKAKATGDNICLCGCGTKVGGKFAPGHDARVKGMLLRVERGESAKADLPEELSKLVKFTGRAGSEDYRIAQAPVKFPGRDDIQISA